MKTNRKVGETMSDNKHHWQIYMYTFPNGKRYIGKTNRTMNQRQGAGFNRYTRCRLLWNAIQKYGIENVTQEVLYEDDITDTYAARLEQLSILLFKTNCNRFRDPVYGYNLTDGGEGVKGWKPSPERRQQLAEQMREIGIRRIGTHPSEITRQKLREAKLGTKRGPMSEETRRKISESNRERSRTEETYNRRSKAMKKRVRVLDVVSGHETVYDSVTAVADAFNVSLPRVSTWLSGSRKPPEGYSFYYA